MTTPVAMYIIFLLTAFVFTASAIPQDEWTTYKVKYNKVYTSEGENMRRLEQYLKTKEMVEEHNRKYDRGETTYTMGINKFSDWFPEELKALTPVMPQRAWSGGKPFELPPGTTVPDSINWVEKGAVTSVKDEGKCVSGYAFSAAGALEGLMFITNNTITDLSVQELLDCVSDLGGCLQGPIFPCFDYVKAREGIDTEESYPYEAKRGKCRADEGKVGATCTGYYFIDDEAELREAVGRGGPVSINLAAAYDFFHYKQGIYDGMCFCSPNHGMLAVGYDTDEATKTPYWLLKNSWGQDWGEKGYARVIRNKNKCTLANYALLPTYSN